MKTTNFIRFLIFFPITGISTAQQQTTFRGAVFSDENTNGIFDKNEKGLENVCISNGTAVIQTNTKGEWLLEAIDLNWDEILKSIK